MSNKRPKVTYADRICNLLKGEKPEQDNDQDDWESEDQDDGDYKYLSEQEIIERQRRLPKKKKEPEEDHAWMHTLDGGGSFVFTGLGNGIWPDETTLTHFTGNKKREKR